MPAPAWQLLAGNNLSDVPSPSAAMGNLSGMSLVTTTGVSGFNLANGTPTIVSWTAPNDGNLHRVLVVLNVLVTSAETGGAIGANVTLPNGTGKLPGLSPGGAGTGLSQFTQAFFVEAGTTISLQQTSALTVGAAVVWADLWAL